MLGPESVAPYLTIDGVTREIDDAYIDTDGGFDDIGVGVMGSTNFGFSAGDLVSWKRSMLVATDINDLVLGSYSSDTYGGTP